MSNKSRYEEDIRGKEIAFNETLSKLQESFDLTKQEATLELERCVQYFNEILNELRVVFLISFKMLILSIFSKRE